MRVHSKSLAMSEKLRRRAHEIIPGGAHTYAKGDDQYPVLAPAFIARGSGCHVWDADDNEYIEYGMGNRAVGLGHAYPAVIEAVRSLFLQETIRRGVLMPSLVLSYTHADEDIDRTIEAVDGALAVYVKALQDGVEHFLVGRPSDTVYRRFNKAPAPEPVG